MCCSTGVCGGRTAMGCASLRVALNRTLSRTLRRKLTNRTRSADECSVHCAIKACRCLSATSSLGHTRLRTPSRPGVRALCRQGNVAAGSRRGRAPLQPLPKPRGMRGESPAPVRCRPPPRKGLTPARRRPPVGSARPSATRLLRSGLGTRHEPLPGAGVLHVAQLHQERRLGLADIKRHLLDALSYRMDNRKPGFEVCLRETGLSNPAATGVARLRRGPAYRRRVRIADVGLRQFVRPIPIVTKW